MVLKLGQFKKYIKNTFKGLKYDVGEGLRRSVVVIV
jgi:hypothetical protein